MCLCIQAGPEEVEWESHQQKDNAMQLDVMLWTACQESNFMEKKIGVRDVPLARVIAEFAAHVSSKAGRHCLCMVVLVGRGCAWVSLSWT